MILFLFLTRTYWIFMTCFMFPFLQKCQTWNKAAQEPLTKTMGESWCNQIVNCSDGRTRSSEEIFTTMTSACRPLSTHSWLHWRLICILLSRALHNDTVHIQWSFFICFNFFCCTLNYEYSWTVLKYSTVHCTVFHLVSNTMSMSCKEMWFIFFFIHTLMVWFSSQKTTDCLKTPRSIQSAVKGVHIC